MEKYYLTLNTHYLMVPYLQSERRIRVLLPKDYEKSTKRYPVVYMHDGQNVFYSREAFSGHSWKVIPMVKRNPDTIPEMIIVGIDHAEEQRVGEYSFWDIQSKDEILKGQGEAYGEFLVDCVKPFIDAHYRTISDKKHTTLIGSSMGGNITATLGVKYSHIFGNLGIFSLASWITPKEFKAYIDALTDTQQHIYIQVGANEQEEADKKYVAGNIAQLYIDHTLSYYNQLIANGVPLDNIHLQIVANGKHSEHVWAKYLPECIKFISKGWS